MGLKDLLKEAKEKTGDKLSVYETIGDNWLSLSKSERKAILKRLPRNDAAKLERMTKKGLETAACEPVESHPTCIPPSDEKPCKACLKGSSEKVKE